MKYVLISDLHSTSPEKVLGEGERVIALGDYDKPGILEDLLGIPDAVICIGNHDHRLVVEWQFPENERGFVGSKFLPDYDSPEYTELMRRWNENEKAREFVLKEDREKPRGLVGLKEIEIAGRKFACVHSSLLDGEIDTRTPCSLWTKPKNDYVVGENFRVMEKNDYWLLLRGHSHLSSIISVGMNEDLSRDRFSLYSCKLETENKTVLQEDRKYIVSAGIFRFGEYAVYDSETREFEFRRIGS